MSAARRPPSSGARGHADAAPAMRIVLRKRTGDRHTLEIVRSDGRREAVDCETRSYLLHDLLHYAVESEARLERGFWGNLADGKTLAQMNDRTGAAMQAEAPEMAAVERTVGALTAAAKGAPAARVVEALRSYAGSLGEPLPSWLDEAFVAAVEERMRRLLGRWNATPFGAAMELDWPA